MNMHTAIGKWRSTSVAATSALAQALAKFRKREAERVSFVESVVSPTQGAYEEAVEALPHFETVRSYLDKGKRVKSSTRDKSMIAEARALLKVISTLGHSDTGSDFLEMAKELVILADRRDEAIEKLNIQYRLTEIFETDCRNSDATVEAEEEVINSPVSSMQELCEKLDFIDEREAWELDAAGPAIAANVRHLAAYERRRDGH